MMAELLVKGTGLCRGRGDSMHITDVKNGVYEANVIVGVGIHIAAGLAYSSLYNNEDYISATFFGEGAANESVLYETLNLAGIYRLPILFVCENNKYAQTTPAKITTSRKDIKSRTS
jgi:acetoin:2,6-dichlorophenolindophenol oxidoreductase subunit alpha